MFRSVDLAQSQERFDGVTGCVEVVRLGGFSRAAEHWGPTRSAVGKAIARLETRLATRLFHRTTRLPSRPIKARSTSSIACARRPNYRPPRVQMASGSWRHIIYKYTCMFMRDTMF